LVKSTLNKLCKSTQIPPSTKNTGKPYRKVKNLKMMQQKLLKPEM